MGADIFPNSFFPRTYFNASYWPKTGFGAFVPPVGAGRSQLLPLMGVGLFLLLAVFLSARAHGHGDAQWIAEGRYTGDDGVHCCGPADCDRVPMDQPVQRVPGGWMLSTGQMFKDNQPGFYESEDLNWWWCKAGPGHHRCLFRAQTAT